MTNQTKKTENKEFDKLDTKARTEHCIPDMISFSQREEKADPIQNTGVIIYSFRKIASRRRKNSPWLKMKTSKELKKIAINRVPNKIVT